MISLSHGAEWKALLSKYIGTIPVNGVATAGADDQNRDVLVEVAAGGEFVDDGAIELRQALGVELLEGLAGAEGGARNGRGRSRTPTRRRGAISY